MKIRLLPALALAAIISVSACAGETSTAPEPRPSSGPVDTSLMPPQTGQPSPDPTTPAPTGAVTEANLPAASDLQWNEAAMWQEDTTSVGGGTEQLMACQQNSIESLGANSIQVRTFTLTGGGDAVAVAMSFDSRELADQAYTTAQGWFADCAQVLVAQGRTDGSQGMPLTSVTIPNGRAQVTEWAYRTPTTDPNSLEFESQGLVQVADRVELVAMRIEGQDNNWDFEPGGPVGMVHPMIRSLPDVATKLAG